MISKSERQINFMEMEIFLFNDGIMVVVVNEHKH